MYGQSGARSPAGGPRKLCRNGCDREASRLGLCGRCYSRQYRQTQEGVRRPRRTWTTCLVCGDPIRVRPGVRYCAKHEWCRRLSVLLTSRLRVREAVRFVTEPVEELLEQAAASIRILRPDGTEDVERGRVERTRWLARRRKEDDGEWW